MTQNPKYGPRNITKLPDDGYIVLPLSLTRLTNWQGPEVCYEIISYFTDREKTRTHDFVLLYTDGLYYNNDESSFELRRRFNEKMLVHRNALSRLIEKDNRLIPAAFHFLPWDYILLESPEFVNCLNRLVGLSKTSKEFAEVLKNNLGDRPYTAANQYFIMEEVAAAHLIRQRMVRFPSRLVRHDRFRLVVYPGKYVLTDFYQWKKKLLPQTDKENNRDNPYYASHYDWDQKLLWNFDDISLPEPLSS